MNSLLFFLAILIFLITLIFLISISTLKIKIIKLHISNIQKKWKILYEIEIGFYLFAKLRYFKIIINNKNQKKLFQLVRKIQKKDTALKNMLQQSNVNKKEIVKYLNIINPELEKFHLQLKVDTEDVLLTTSITTLISSLISVWLSNAIKKFKEEKYFYEILPLYQNKNLIKIDLNCIICIKVVHIIHIIYIVLKKERREEDGRTSNRRVDDNRNEQHKRHDRCKYYHRRAN